jgi:hypothetical protein
VSGPDDPDRDGDDDGPDAALEPEDLPGRGLTADLAAPLVAKEIGLPGVSDLITVSQDELPLPTAYCAPGRQFTAALTLALRGERVAEIVEHPWLPGSTDVLIVNTAEITAWLDRPVVFELGPIL